MLPDFPITSFLPDICEKLKNSPSRALVLTAETGAGKSTILPLGLLQNFKGKILMTEPRRLAVLGVASRVSELLEEECGQTVGYKIHLESKTGRDTRLEVMTEAVLVRMLQENPALEGYNVVVLDEAHERSVNFDLALAFVREAMELRDDLYVIVMSATIDGRKMARFLGGEDKGGGSADAVVRSNSSGGGSVEGGASDASVYSVPGRVFPVDVIYDTKSTVEQAVIHELNSNQKGNILVFLPGISDIRRCEENLRAAGVGQGSSGERGSFREGQGSSASVVHGSCDTQLFILHSSISLEEQKKVLAADNSGDGSRGSACTTDSGSDTSSRSTVSSTRRVILSSAIAETSLTVPGITTVIDSGLARVSRMDVATGMEKLVTERESEFSAEQRKGRAGRLQAGRCIRLWSQHDVRVQTLAPEILRCDLSNLVLECADRGITDFTKIRWLDSPNAAQWTESSVLLQQFGLLDDAKKITQKGRAALTLGMHPRLANLAIEGCAAIQESAPDGKAVACAGESEISAGSCNRRGMPSPTRQPRSGATPSAGVPATPLSPAAASLIIKYGGYDKASPYVQSQFLQDLYRRLQKIDFSKLESLQKQPDVSSADLSAYLMLCGFPDRLAHRISESGAQKAEYQFAFGRKAILCSDSKKTPEWLVAPEVLTGNSEIKIFEFEEISSEFVQKWLKNRTKIVNSFEFVNGKVKKSENLCFGKIILSSKNLPAEPSDYAQAWCQLVQEKGIACLPQDKNTEKFLQRVSFYWQQKKNAASDELQNHLQNTVGQWLVPFVNSTNLSAENVYQALYWYLEGDKVDREVPEFIILPNGKKAKVKYEQLASPENKNQLVIRPVIEIIIQRMFGCFTTPAVCGMKVLLRLLSPASRPLQITDDLENFWTSTWTEICKEMKGRYPKHNWDYKVVEKGE